MNKLSHLVLAVYGSVGVRELAAPPPPLDTSEHRASSKTDHADKTQADADGQICCRVVVFGPSLLKSLSLVDALDDFSFDLRPFPFLLGPLVLPYWTFE